MTIGSAAARTTTWVILAVVASLVLPAHAFALTSLWSKMYYTPTPPSVVTDTIDNFIYCQGEFYVRVVNGNGAGSYTVTSATVTLNGTVIVGGSDLTQGVTEVIKPIPAGLALNGINTHTIEFGAGSAPGSYIRVEYLADRFIFMFLGGVAPGAGDFAFSDRVTVSGRCGTDWETYTLTVNGIATACIAEVFSVADVPLSPGSNTIAATLSAGGYVTQDQRTVTVDRSPVANAGKDKYVATRTTATVDGRDSFDPEGTPITYSWHFVETPGRAPALNDPTFATPSFEPRFDGRYVLSLVVSDGRSNSAPDNVVVTAGPPNVPPVANAGPDQSVVTGSLVNLAGSGTDADGDPITFFWQFLSRPEGSQAALSNPAIDNTSFVADVDGQYVAELTVFDGKEYSLPDNVVVTAATPNARPVANAGPDNTVSRNTLIHLDGTQSSDADNNALTFAWSVVSQPAGSTSVLDNAASPTPAMLADAEGQYVFRLVVNDGLEDSDPSTVVITSINDPPVAEAGPDQNVARNTALTLDGSGSHDANGDPITYLWTLLSVPAGSTTTLGNPTVVNPLLTPDLAGGYVASLTVSDGRLSSAPDNVVITAALLSITVPNVTGLTQANAQAAIVAATLAVGAVTSVNSDNVAAGNVIGQNPAAGSIVPEGSPVDLVVSLGPVMVTVPAVTGLTQAGAQGALVAASLAVGTVTQSSSPTVPAGNVISQSPSAGTVVVHGTAVDLVVSSGPPPVAVPDLFGKPQASAQALLSNVGLTTGTTTSGNSEVVIPGNVMGQSPAAGTEVTQGSSVSLVISSGYAPVSLPPDPATVAPPVDQTVATSVYASTEFLYTGDNAVQTGMAAGTIELKRAAVLRGKVMTADNAALSGVVVTVLDHPEFGQTLSRESGEFDVAVNGGGLLTVNYRKGGYLPVQRQVNVPWQDFVVLPEIVMVPYDNHVTTIDLSQATPIQVARGPVTSDERGTRQSTLFFPQGTQATMIMPDGSTRPLTSLSVRATEYTVGPNGPKAMPAELPPTTGYTYCVELSVDEAVAAGAKEVWFSQPVVKYLENFVGIPVGEPVPVGLYDRVKGRWVPFPDGVVLKVLGITNGRADMDTNGDGAADNAALLSALGITDAEREQVAALYAPGATLWRAPIPHFTPADLNYPLVPGLGDVPPNQMDPETYDPSNSDCKSSSIVECQNQVLGERIDVSGTPASLSYRSDRVRGFKDAYSMKIFLTGASVPTTLERIELVIVVAGRRFAQRFERPGFEQPLAANMSTLFTWDGQDIYGRTVQGAQTAWVKIGYVYRPLAYRGVQRVGGGGGGGVSRSFGNGTSRGYYAMPVLTNLEVTLWQDWTGTIGFWDAKAGLGGWNLDLLHSYDPVGRVLHPGGAPSQKSDNRNDVITTVAGTGNAWYNGDGIPATQANLYSPRAVEVGPDGSLYIAEMGNNRVRKVDPNGIISTVAGTGITWHNGDGIAGPSANLNTPWDVAVGKDGSVYISEQGNARIRRVRPDGIITTVAGKGPDPSNPGAYGAWFAVPEGAPATTSYIYGPAGLSVAPDGAIYFAEAGSNRIRRVGTDGMIATVAGTGYYGCYPGDSCPSFDGTVADNVTISGGPRDVAAGADGSFYFTFSGPYVRRVGTDRVMRNVAGTEWGIVYNADGIPATQAHMGPQGISLGPDGSMYIADATNARVRHVGMKGIVRTVAGTGAGAGFGYGYTGDGGLATQATMAYGTPGAAMGPDGSVYVADMSNHVVRKIAPLFPGLSVSDIVVPSRDGSEVYVFNASGKHLRTLNATTGATLYTFAYDANGYVSQVADADNNVTTVERDGAGNPTAIVAPGGQRTALAVDANGYLSSVGDPAGNTTHLVNTADGLLTELTDPNEYLHTFEYDSLGRLHRDNNPEGGFFQLTRTDTPGKYTVALSTAMGRPESYEVEALPTGAQRRTNTYPTGAKSQLTLDVGGKKSYVATDNTTTELIEGKDPRWGVESPIPATSTVRTPGGLVSTAAMSRTASLSNPLDPLSMTAQTDTFVINGKTYTESYSASTKRFTLTSPVGRRTVSGIDAAGRPILFSADPAVDNVSFAYDTKGRLAQTSQGGKSWTFAYDDLNRLTSQTDPLEHQVQYGYDNADRVSRVILPSGRTYNFGYDANGNRTSITMPNGVVHTLGYNKVNLDNSYTPPNNPAYATGYNLDREWTRTTLPSGRTIDGGYDSGGRLHDVTYPEAAVSLTYFDSTDRVGTLTRTSAADNQAIAFSYDGSLTTRVAFSGVANGEYRYSYDNNFRVMSVALDNVWTTLSRDNDGLITRYGPFTITRNGPAGAPSALTDNVLNVSYTYDSFGRVATRTHTVAGQQVYQLILGYDNVGRIGTKTETVAGTAHTFDYTYDLDGQLYEVRRDGVLAEQYGYDNNANRTSTLSTTATYDAQDRLIQQGGVAYTFDGDGYLTQRGSDVFTYSAKGELLSATVGGQTSTYHYDGMGRRIGRTDGTGTTLYLYGDPGNPFQVTASRDAAGILTTYLYDVAGNMYSFDRGGQRYYVATDQLGTPKAVTDATGALVKTIDYDAWGVKLSDSNPTFDLPVGFAGGIADGTTGLVRFGYRDYDPGTGRWAAKDPILFESGQLNLYVYVGNDPVNLFDPEGLTGAEALSLVPEVSISIPALSAIGAYSGPAALVAGAGLVGYGIGTLINEYIIDPLVWGNGNINKKGEQCDVPTSPPEGLTENPNRPGSWGEIGPDGKFKEKWRRDPARPGVKSGHGSKDHIHVGGRWYPIK